MRTILVTIILAASTTATLADASSGIVEVDVIEGLRGKASLSPDFPNPTVPHNRDRQTYDSAAMAMQVLFESNGMTEAKVIAGLSGRANLSPGMDSVPALDTQVAAK